MRRDAYFHLSSALGERPGTLARTGGQGRLFSALSIASCMDLGQF